MTQNIEPKEIKIVGHVQTSLPDPWRTQGDYQQEQKESRERHAMIQEQHKIIQKAHLATIWAAVFAGISALATVSLVFLSYQDKNIQQELQKQAQQQTISKQPTKP